jgi:hypothetical protein
LVFYKCPAWRLCFRPPPVADCGSLTVTMAEPKQSVVTNDDKKIVVSSDTKKGSSDTQAANRPGDPGPSPPYPGMASMGDEDEQLLARIGYRQVCWPYLRTGGED